LKSYPRIKVIDNPRKITPVALNLALARAKGSVVLWMSAHNQYAPDYISKSVHYLNQYSADNVGGIMITLPRNNTLVGRAIAAALSHRFGVGNSVFRTHTAEPTWVDTVFGGCYRRDVFDRIGMFNEKLVRGQDMEFNRRLLKAGGKILLAPDIVTTYYARSGFFEFCVHNWTNGVWAILPFLYSKIVPVSFRHLVPLLLVLALLTTGISAFFCVYALYAFAGLSGLYLLADLAASAHAAGVNKNPALILLLPIIFPVLHFAYGLGSFWGILRVGFQWIFRIGL
jgi:GT2 family glycosyltransferase